MCLFFWQVAMKCGVLALIAVEILFCFRKNTSTALGVTKQKRLQRIAGSRLLKLLFILIQHRIQLIVVVHLHLFVDLHKFVAVFNVLNEIIDSSRQIASLF